jgi:hypothetical protein
MIRTHVGTVPWGFSAKTIRDHLLSDGKYKAVAVAFVYCFMGNSDIYLFL